MAIEERATQPRTVADGKLVHEEWLRDEAQRQGFALYHKWQAPTRYGLSIGVTSRLRSKSPIGYQSVRQIEPCYAVSNVDWKPYISDEQTIRQMDFDQACETFVAAENKWLRLNATVQCSKSADVCACFDALEGRYQAEKNVWKMFIAGDRSLRSGMMYLQFREALMSGKALRADA